MKQLLQIVMLLNNVFFYNIVFYRKGVLNGICVNMDLISRLQQNNKDLKFYTCSVEKKAFASNLFKKNVPEYWYGQ